MKHLLFALFIASVLWGCAGSEEDVPDVSDIEVNFKVRRLEKELQQLYQNDAEAGGGDGRQSKEAIRRFLDENPALAAGYFGRGQYPHDSILINNIYGFIAIGEFNDTLFQDIDRVFGDFKDVEREFEQAFKYIKHYYPEFQAPDIYTAASGFGSFGWGGDLYFGKGFIVVGLDYFAGATATYRPQASVVMPGYLLRRYEKQYIVPTAMLLLSQSFIGSEFIDQSLLADMIFYGKAYQFTQKMLPTYHDTLILGYTEQDLANVSYNQEDIYAHFVKNQLFFETAPNVKQKYVDERPNVPEIADVCPGRIGRWLGWQIVKSYALNNEEVSFQELLKNPKAQQIFQASQYQPKPKQ